MSLHLDIMEPELFLLFLLPTPPFSLSLSLSLSLSDFNFLHDNEGKNYAKIERRERKPQDLKNEELIAFSLASNDTLRQS
jgi:hypothetical protein